MPPTWLLLFFKQVSLQNLFTTVQGCPFKNFPVSLEADFGTALFMPQTTVLLRFASAMADSSQHNFQLAPKTVSFTDLSTPHISPEPEVTLHCCSAGLFRLCNGSQRMCANASAFFRAWLVGAAVILVYVDGYIFQSVYISNLLQVGILRGIAWLIRASFNLVCAALASCTCSSIRPDARCPL